MSFQARILDADALRQITPTALHAYAVAQGWKKAEVFGEHSDVFKLDQHEMILPGNQQLADYVSVVSNVLELFARVEGRDELKVFFDLSTADHDVVRVSTPHAKDDGSVGMDPGVELFVQARNLLLSAACSASDPRRAYRAGRIKEAASYIDRVRLGQTERGSFIVTLLSPVPPSLESSNQPGFWEPIEEEPYERKVTRRLVEGLKAAKAAVEGNIRDGGFQAFDEAVSRGVSANLCEAAATLIEQGEGLDVSVTWARTRLAPKKRDLVSFAPSEAQVLKAAAQVFRDREPRVDEQLHGFIIKLARDEGESDGRATLRAFVDAQPTAVNIELPQAIYEQAVRAHEGQTAVSIRGDLVREKHRWRLKNPRDLTVLDTSASE
jgi:hypothetical protein